MVAQRAMSGVDREVTQGVMAGVDVETEIITPTVEEACKPSETNLSCIYQDCNRTFKHRPALNMHLSMTHKLQGYADLSKKGKRLFLCPAQGCSRSSHSRAFTNMKQLRKHYLDVHAEKTWLCTQCGKMFSCSQRLNLHMQNCGKVYKCCVCHVPYATRDGVMRHQRSQHPTAYKYAKSIIRGQVPAVTAGQGSVPAVPDMNTRLSNPQYSTVSTGNIVTGGNDSATASQSALRNHSNQSAGISQSNSSSVQIIQSEQNIQSTNTHTKFSISNNSSTKQLNQSDESYKRTSQLDIGEEACQSGDNARRTAKRTESISKVKTGSKAKYVRLLPKPTGQLVHTTTQTGQPSQEVVTDAMRETCATGTQTSLLDKAIRSSGIIIGTSAAASPFPPKVRGRSNTIQPYGRGGSHCVGWSLSYNTADTTPIDGNQQLHALVGPVAPQPQDTYNRLRSSTLTEFGSQCDTLPIHSAYPSLRPSFTEFGTQYIAPTSTQTDNPSLRSSMMVEFGTQYSAPFAVQTENPSLRSSRLAEFGTQYIAPPTVPADDPSLRSSRLAEFGTRYISPPTLSAEIPSLRSTIGNEINTRSSTPFPEASSCLESCEPADFGTQTSFVEYAAQPSTSNMDLGTQTTLSALLAQIGSSSSSIELQCDLGDASLDLIGDDVLSFGTQTNDSPSMDISPTSAEMSSFGTQTTQRRSDLDIPTTADFSALPHPLEAVPAQQSTSDFAMQFPYELMDFGTQTPLPLPLPDPDFVDAATFMFDNDDDLLNPQSNGPILSQSSTQTDLDFLFNNIETQTDWQF